MAFSEQGQGMIMLQTQVRKWRQWCKHSWRRLWYDIGKETLWLWRQVVNTKYCSLWTQAYNLNYIFDVLLQNFKQKSVKMKSIYYRVLNSIFIWYVIVRFFRTVRGLRVVLHIDKDYIIILPIYYIYFVSYCIQLQFQTSERITVTILFFHVL
jgi:hypothetical protein